MGDLHPTDCGSKLQTCLRFRPAALTLQTSSSEISGSSSLVTPPKGSVSLKNSGHVTSQALSNKKAFLEKKNEEIIGSCIDDEDLNKLVFAFKLKNAYNLYQETLEEELRNPTVSCANKPKVIY